MYSSPFSSSPPAMTFPQMSFKMEGKGREAPLWLELNLSQNGLSQNGLSQNGYGVTIASL